MTETIVILAGSLSIVVLVRIPRHLIPRHYFEMFELIHGMNGAVTWPGIAIRFSIPFVVGLAAALVAGSNHIFVGGLTGLLGGLLLIWPSLIDRRLLPWQAQSREVELYLVFGMFVASFGLLGVLAGVVAGVLQQPVDDLFSGEGFQNTVESISPSGSDVIQAIIVAVVIAALAAGWKKFYALIMRGPQDD